MSNSVNTPSDNRQVPVETYKCSQCNFYTNHEYYLEQHNLTHSLQSIMEHQHKHNLPYNPNGQGQSYIKGSPTLEAVELSTKPFFKTDQETFCKDHSSSSPTTEYCSNQYATFKTLNHEYNINDDGFDKTHIGLSHGDSFEAREFESPCLDNVDFKLQGCKSSDGSFVVVNNELKESPSLSKYENQTGDSLVENSSNCIPESSNNETTYR